MTNPFKIFSERKKITKSVWLIIASLFLVGGGATVYAVATQYYSIPHTNSREITAFNVCKKVTNNSSVYPFPLLVPVKAEYEWLRFRMSAGDKVAGTSEYIQPNSALRYSEAHGINIQECTAPPVIDVCPNIAGNQSTIPAGQIVDENGNCVSEVPPGNGGTNFYECNVVFGGGYGGTDWIQLCNSAGVCHAWQGYPRNTVHCP